LPRYGTTHPCLYRQLRQVFNTKDARNEQLVAAYKNSATALNNSKSSSIGSDTRDEAKQVQSRIKELEKIERIEIPEEEKTIHFSFPQPKRADGCR